MSHDDPGAKDATKKYQQIVVPDHALKPDTSGTSFLRTGTFPSLTDTTKQPPGFRESLELAQLAGDHHLKTGGSWHHVDGNRIETTTGRKVEVIAGSYVAHRGPGNSPGPNFSATWATNSYTQIGSLDLPVGWNPGPPVTPNNTGVDDPPDNFVESLSFPFSTNLTFNPLPGNVKVPTSDIDVIPPGTSNNSNARLQPGDVASVTWAQRALTYVGSTTKPVWLVYAETQAGTIKAKNFAQIGDVVSWNHAPYGKYWQDALATTILTTNEAKADITVTNTAPNILTNNIGTQEVLNLAPVMLTATAAGAVFNVIAAATVANVTAAAEIYNVNFGMQTVISAPENQQFMLSNGKIVAADSDMAAVRTRVDALKSALSQASFAAAATAAWATGNTSILSQVSTELTQISNDLAEMKNLGS